MNDNQRQTGAEVKHVTKEQLTAMATEYLELCQRQDSLMKEIFDSLSEN